MQSFKEHTEQIPEEINEGAISKSPAVLAALLWRTYSKIKSSKNPDEVAKYQAQMTWISGQLSFNYIKSLEDRLINMEKIINDIKRG